MIVKRLALIVGISNYPTMPLIGPVNDAIAVKEVLSKDGDGQTNFETLLVNDCETKNKLLRHLHDLFSKELEIALFYFAGHGYENPLGTYLVTPDSAALDSGVSMTDLMTLINNSPAQNKIIILDCCHAGALGTSKFTGGVISSIANGVTILTACRGDEKAYETRGAGIFTSLLVDALKGGAADISGYISPGHVYSYIDQSLGPHDQRPLFKTNVHEFVTLRKVAPKVDTTILRNIVTYFPQPDEPYHLDPSHEDTNDPSIPHLFEEPYATPEKVAIFKELQKFQSVGLVVPVSEQYMYFAAMRRKTCELTALGRHYWHLIKKGYIS